MSIDQPVGTCTVGDLRPWPEVQALLPPLSQAQFEELQRSIQEDGLRIPILCLPDGRIVDGYHRHLCCQELGITPQVTVLDVPEAEAFRLALTLNLARRHLSHDQLQELRRWQRDQYFAHRRAGMSQAEAAARVGVAQRTGSYWENAGHDRGASEVSALDLRLKVPKKLSRRLYERVSSGETIDQVAADIGISTRHLRRIVRDVQSVEPQAASPLDALGADDRWVVHTGDMSVLDGLVPDGSAALILSDPPWDADSVHLYSRLAELASRKLTADGLCIAFTGKYHLHEALARMLEHLAYYWVFAFELSDRHPVAWDKRIWSAWRPLIAGQRRDGDGTRRGEWLLDLLPSGRMDKRHHAWQQSLSPVAYLVEKLTRPGDLVVDPLCGTGTVGVACRLLGRRFIGSEINPETAAVARERIRRAEEERADKLGS